MLNLPCDETKTALHGDQAILKIQAIALELMEFASAHPGCSCEQCNFINSRSALFGEFQKTPDLVDSPEIEVSFRLLWLSHMGGRVSRKVTPLLFVAPPAGAVEDQL
jgi:hypothetical protein